ncbi:MAG: MFS transporter [Solirubrobacterales bacterium]|nr:MFS transporter [Solirubrobacterales bacterium]
MSTVTGGRGVPAPRASSGWRRLWDRQLPHYPDTAPRMVYLAITVLATITLYYELYIQGAVATKIIQHFNFSFTQFVFVLVIGNACGAFASLGAGLADRWGRANLVVGGLLLTGLLILFALPNAPSKGWYTVFFALVSIVEGMALVATPALIRDFSPQVGRGAAMAFWTMGPVLGSLVVTEVSSHTLTSHPDWQFQFRLCGVVGLIVWAITFVGLRELSPRLRDQLMVSLRDRALIEARAAGIDSEKLRAHHWRQMLRLDIVGPALAISLFLMLYYVFVGFLVVYFATVFGYTEARTNQLGNWFWIANAIALLIAGLASDRLLVRKPFMIVGAIISLIGVGLFASAATAPSTGYHTFAFYFILIAGGTGLAYVSWMAAYTETVEKHNPAATATGLAVWGWTIRIVVTASFALLTAVVPATSALVDQGPRVKAIAAQYPQQVKVLGTVDPATLAALKTNPGNLVAQTRALSQLSGLPPAQVARVALLGTRYRAELATLAAVDPATLGTLQANPTNRAAGARAVGEIAVRFGIPPSAALGRLQAVGRVPPADLLFLRANGPRVQQAGAALRSVSTVPPADLAYLAQNGPKVAQAQKDNPGQWQTWWWICFAGQVLFIPAVFLLTGHWSPRKARQQEREHERMVQRELARLQESRAPAG